MSNCCPSTRNKVCIAPGLKIHLCFIVDRTTPQFLIVTTKMVYMFATYGCGPSWPEHLKKSLFTSFSSYKSYNCPINCLCRLRSDWNSSLCTLCVFTYAWGGMKWHISTCYRILFLAINWSRVRCGYNTRENWAVESCKPPESPNHTQLAAYLSA